MGSIECWVNETWFFNTHHHARPRANLSMSIALVASSTIHDANWYPDSGATYRMTPNPLNLIECIDYGGSDKVIVGNGSGLHINHVGKSCFYFIWVLNLFILINCYMFLPLPKIFWVFPNLPKTIKCSSNFTLTFVVLNVKISRRSFSKEPLIMVYTSFQVPVSNL